MKKIITAFLVLMTLTLTGQNLIIEDPSAEVAIFRSATGTSRLNFENTNAPLLGSDKRGFLMSNNNNMVIGTSNNNQGGDIILQTYGNDRVTLAADGRLGIGKTPDVNTLLQVESQDVQTAWMTKTGNTNGNVLNLTNSASGSSSNVGISATVNGNGTGGKIGVLSFVTGTGSFLRAISGQAPDQGHAGYFIGRTKTTKSMTVGDHPQAVSPEKGTIRYNDEIDDFEGYDGTHWKSLTTNARSNFNSVGETVTDIDGNVYRTVNINGQIWMRENLRTSRYANGDQILEIADESDFGNNTTGAWCWYDNNAKNDECFGKLYNYAAVLSSKELCPTGWDIPTHSDWNSLLSLLPSGFEGGALKEAGEDNWESTNLANNDTGFTALPAGERFLSGGSPSYKFKSEKAFFWINGEEIFLPPLTEGVDAIELNFDEWDVTETVLPVRFGLSVRCIKK